MVIRAQFTKNNIVEVMIRKLLSLMKCAVHVAVVKLLALLLILKDVMTLIMEKQMNTVMDVLLILQTIVIFTIPIPLLQVKCVVYVVVDAMTRMVVK